MSRILPRFYRQQLQAEDAAHITHILREAGADTTTHEPKKHYGATLPGDKRRLRGIPVVGGVGGTSPGTDPVAELLRKEHARTSSDALCNNHNS